MIIIHILEETFIQEPTMTEISNMQYFSAGSWYTTSWQVNVDTAAAGGNYELPGQSN